MLDESECQEVENETDQQENENLQGKTTSKSNTDVNESDDGSTSHKNNLSSGNNEAKNWKNDPLLKDKLESSDSDDMNKFINKKKIQSEAELNRSCFILLYLSYIYFVIFMLY